MRDADKSSIKGYIMRAYILVTSNDKVAMLEKRKRDFIILVLLSVRSFIIQWWLFFLRFFENIKKFFRFYNFLFLQRKYIIYKNIDDKLIFFYLTQTYKISIYQNVNFVWLIKIFVGVYLLLIKVYYYYFYSRPIVANQYLR